MRRAWTCGAVLALSSFGCGSNPAGTSSADDGGSPPPPIDAAARDVAPPSDAPGDVAIEGAAESGMPPLPYYGKVQYFRIDEGTTTNYEVQLRFLPAASLVSALECPPGSVNITSGGCCLAISAADAGANPQLSVSAGAMVSVAHDGTTFASLAYDAQGMDYIGFNANNPPTTTSWSPRDTLAVSAPGATVQAFSGSVSMPAPLQGLSVAPSSLPMVKLSTDWTITWTPGQGASKVMLLLGSGNVELRCVVSDTAGSVTAPSALLGHFQPNTFGAAYIESVVVSPVSSGDATVELGAFNQVFLNVGFQP